MLWRQTDEEFVWAEIGVLFVDQKRQISRFALRHELRTPRAAAIAGIIFSVLLTTTIVLLHFAITSREALLRDWFVMNEWRLKFALNLVPIAGVAFIWFIGVLRDRLGAAEDRFFTTVFWSSAIVFLTMFFVSTAVVGAIVFGLSSNPLRPDATGVYAFGQAVSAQLLNVYSLKMAAVLMISTATLGMRTQFIPRWIALPGYALAVLLLVSSHFLDWLSLVFPLWIFVMSIYILFDNFHKSNKTMHGAQK